MYDTEKEQAEHDRDAHKLRNKIPFSPKVSIAYPTEVVFQRFLIPHPRLTCCSGPKKSTKQVGMSAKSL